MKLVYTNENMAIVHSAKNLLEMNDIDCLIKNEHGYTMGAEFGITNVAEVWVLNEKDYAKAVEVISNQISNPTEKGNWICDQCNEENAGSFEVCWQCQSERKEI